MVDGVGVLVAVGDGVDVLVIVVGVLVKVGGMKGVLEGVGEVVMVGVCVMVGVEVVVPVVVGWVTDWGLESQDGRGVKVVVESGWQIPPVSSDGKGWSTRSSDS